MVFIKQTKELSYYSVFHETTNANSSQKIQYCSKSAFYTIATALLKTYTD